MASKGHRTCVVCQGRDLHQNPALIRPCRCDILVHQECMQSLSPECPKCSVLLRVMEGPGPLPGAGDPTAFRKPGGFSDLLEDPRSSIFHPNPHSRPGLGLGRKCNLCNSYPSPFPGVNFLPICPACKVTPTATNSAPFGLDNDFDYGFQFGKKF